MTLSFYVKSNKTGSYSVQLFDVGGTIYSKLVIYTIVSADTWERKEITVQANPNGSNPTLSNAEGLRIAFDLGSGPDDIVPIYDWSSTYGGATRSISGQVNILDSTSNYWQITGVQLEVGDTATPFEHRSFGDELARCQRYYYAHLSAPTGNQSSVCTSANYSSLKSYGTVNFPVTMRATPSLNAYSASAAWYIYYGNTSSSFDTLNHINVTPTTALVFNNDNVGITQGQAANIQAADTTNCYVHFDAEL
jgi:hypothetical protein